MGVRQGVAMDFLNQFKLLDQSAMNQDKISAQRIFSSSKGKT
jgi:hypothetical protein